jgi:hypothetical protein
MTPLPPLFLFHWTVPLSFNDPSNSMMELSNEADWDLRAPANQCSRAGKLQVRSSGEISSQPGNNHAAAGRGVLEVTV